MRTGRPMRGPAAGMTATHNSQDVMFAQMMIPHHRQAITMAKTEQGQGINADAKALADSIVTSQSAEITRMQDLLRNI
jgi:uncharacterized protein (DUF305 family)